MKNNAKELLAAYIDALCPMIYIHDFDFQAVDKMINAVADGRKILEYHHGLGTMDFQKKSLIKACNLEEFLNLVKDEGYQQPVLIVLKDAHNQLNRPEIIALLKYIAQRNLDQENYYATVLMISKRFKIPEELEDFITVFEMPLPIIDEIQEMITAFAQDLSIEISQDKIERIANALKGFHKFQIQQILNLLYQNSGNLDFPSQQKQLIWRQKEQMVRKSGLLEMITVHETIEDMGGLENLKEWLLKKQQIFAQLDKAIEFGVDIPKGILIAGMPGCGKSLAAKVTASLFEIPLVRFNIGQILGKYIGESEENMRRALKLSEAISPCVLWMDEIETAFFDDGTAYLFGQFLTWMQEKEDAVFVIATANDITKIPPEFLQKGRFDERFLIDFPNDEERRKILEIHLKRRHKWNKDLDIISLVKRTNGYNSADLEAIVKDAIENCFLEGRSKLTTEDLQNAQKRVKSISRTLEKRMREIRQSLENIDLKPASSDNRKTTIRPFITGFQKPAVPNIVDSTAMTLVEIFGKR